MDLSDMDAKVEWAMKNDADAKKIAMNARNFAERHLQSAQLHCYSYLLLLEMGRLMGNQ
jgi:hypothetical protein